jgi:hypothetical protein
MLMAWAAVGVGESPHLENPGGFANTCDMGPVLERERAFYNAHQAEWAALRLGRFVVVKGEEPILATDGEPSAEVGVEPPGASQRHWQRRLDGVPCRHYLECS